MGTLYIYYDGHNKRWVVTQKDPGVGRILRCEWECDSVTSPNFYDGDKLIEQED